MIVSSSFVMLFQRTVRGIVQHLGSFVTDQNGSEGKARERKSSSVNTGFVFYIVLMAGLAKRMLSDLLTDQTGETWRDKEKQNHLPEHETSLQVF